MRHQARQRHRRRRRLLQRLTERGRFADLQPHPEADGDKQRTCKEGDAPAPCRELGIRKPYAQQQKQAVRRKEAYRRAKLRRRAKACLPTLWCVLHGQKRRPAPLTAKAKALPKAQDAQKQRRDPPDHGVSRQESDQERGRAHQEQGRDQSGLTADPVAKMPKRNRAHGASDKCNAKAHEGEEGLRRFRFSRKEQGPEHQRGSRRIDVKSRRIRQLCRPSRRSGYGRSGGQDAWRAALACRPSGVKRKGIAPAQCHKRARGVARALPLRPGWDLDSASVAAIVLHGLAAGRIRLVHIGSRGLI